MITALEFGAMFHLCPNIQYKRSNRPPPPCSAVLLHLLCTITTIALFATMSPHSLTLSDDYDQAVYRDQSLGTIFKSRAQRCPGAIAVVDGDITLTYAQLHAHASYLASRLTQNHLAIQEPVGIVVQHGVADVVAQMAVIYAGGTCAPMDPELLDTQIESRLKRVGARNVLVDSRNQSRHIPFDLLCLNGSSTGSARNTCNLSQFPVATNLNHRTHLIHTSGTTSEPKAVQIAARSILHVVYHAPFEPVHESDVVAHVNNSSFDVSLFDIWAPLLRGARIAVLEKTVLLDVPLMEQEIDRLGITVMATTTALLNLAASTHPTAFAKLRICFIGGEAANIPAVGRILTERPPKMLVNAYGPTECCIFCLAHQITLQDVRMGSVSIGKPIGATAAYIVDDEGQFSNEGELWIAGPGVSPGYLNLPEKNATAFRMVTGVEESDSNPVRMYRTGDVVRRRLDGQIDYIGRRDHQVKIRGFRVELGAVETALLGTSFLAEAVAMKVEIPQEGVGSVLCAYGVLKVGHVSTSTDEIVNAVRVILPEYMVPQLVLIDHMPLNSHGKVDRKLLANHFSQRWKDDTPPPEPKNAAQGARSALCGLWCKILASQTPVYDDNDNFISLGGTSLQAAMLINHIRQTFNIEISLLTLYRNMTMGALTLKVEERLGGRRESVHDERELWLADSKIADDLPAPSGQVVDWIQDAGGHVFLTGATGFVGAFFLKDLLCMKHVRQVSCLVRAVDTVAGLSRLKDAMAKYGLWEQRFETKLVALLGLLEDEYLGLGQNRFDEMALSTSVVFHLGAHVNYTQPYSLHRSANTLGTLNIVRFACAGRVKPIHYVSSISCFGPTGYVTKATVIREDEPLLPHLDALPYDHGYAQSQWVAEQLLRNLIDRGFPIVVYRPGFITGHSRTGACNPDDFFGRLMQACCEMGCYPLLPNQRKEFVPVDYVVSAILHIAISSSSSIFGHAYHIVPPSRQQSVDMDETMDMVSEAMQIPLHGVSYDEWVEQLRIRSPIRLLPLQPMLMEKVHDGRTRWELYENMPIYETTNTTKALADFPGTLRFPDLGPSLMRKYAMFLEASSRS